MKNLNKLLAVVLIATMISMVTVSSFAEDTTGEAVAPVTVEQAVSEPIVTPQPQVEVTDQPASTQEPSATEQPASTQEPSVTEQPNATTAADAEATPTADPTQETLVAETGTPDLSSVSISTQCVTNGTLQYGDSITVVAQITGLDGIAYGMQWQYFNGTEWQNQAGANDSSYSFTLTKTNANYLWRMAVTVDR